jgi:hypothetical protein
MNERLLKSDFLESEILKRKFEETASLEDIEWLKDKFNGCMETVSVSLFPAFFCSRELPLYFALAGFDETSDYLK